ncbi:Flagellar hook-length control protein FliK [Planctomycetes bacterium MalM25]|nr:Flagellar hook-length control protein FliK [Planctomycetes bacterium MalM25]
MNTPLNPTPSLLTLTAPTAERAPDEPAAGVFAEQLSAVTEPASEQREERDEEAPEPEASQDPKKSDREPQAATDDSGTESSPEVDTREGELEQGEEGLLAISLASETIVAETSPHAELPEHAATTVDVGLPAGPATPIEVSPESSEPTEANAPSLPVDLGDSLGEHEGDSGEANESLPGAGVAEAGLEGEEATGAQSHAHANRVREDDPSSKNLKGAAGTADAPSEATSQAASSSTIPKGDTGVEAEISTKSEPATPPLSAGAEAPVTDNPSTADSTQTREAVAAPHAADANNERATVERSAPGETRPEVDPARFVTRVSRAVEAAHERGGPIEIRLSPPELGSLRVQIEMKEGLLSASLEAETPAARNTLLDNLPALRERLEQQQIRLEKFDVDVRDDSQQRGGGGAPEGETQRRPDDSPERREPTPEHRTDRESATTESERSVATITFDDDGLNLVA